MSNIEDYARIKREHDELAAIINNALNPENDCKTCVGVGGLTSNNEAAQVQFSFAIKRNDMYECRMTSRLADFIRQSCNALKKSILEEAIALSENELMCYKEAAKAEAREILND